VGSPAWRDQRRVAAPENIRTIGGMRRWRSTSSSRSTDIRSRPSGDSRLPRRWSRPSWKTEGAKHRDMAGRIHRSFKDSRQPPPIAQVQLDASGDAAAQVGPSGLSGSAGWSGADQGFSGGLDQILPLHQREQAPGGSGSQGISEVPAKESRKYARPRQRRALMDRRLTPRPTCHERHQDPDPARGRPRA